MIGHHPLTGRRPSPRRNAVQKHPALESLEGRTLLSLAADTHAALGGVDRYGSVEIRKADVAPTPEQLVGHVYRNVLGREPMSGELHKWTARLERGLSVEKLAVRILVSRESLAAAGDLRGFVNALYQKVLRRQPDPEQQKILTRMLARRDVTRAALAHKFLRDADSFLNDPVGGGGGGFGGGGSGGGVAGSISSVTISAPGGSRNNGVANPLTATSYQLALNYNGTPGPIAITMKVSGAGTYTLDLSGGGYADNNTRVNWKGYTFAITTSNPAATFLAASPASPFNNTPQLSNGGKSLTFNGGTLPSTGGNASKVHPVIRVSANAPGTIIINATPQT